MTAERAFWKQDHSENQEHDRIKFLGNSHSEKSCVRITFTTRLDHRYAKEDITVSNTEHLRVIEVQEVLWNQIHHRVLEEELDSLGEQAQPNIDEGVHHSTIGWFDLHPENKHCTRIEHDVAYAAMSELRSQYSVHLVSVNDWCQ